MQPKPEFHISRLMLLGEFVLMELVSYAKQKWQASSMINWMSLVETWNIDIIQFVRKSCFCRVISCSPFLLETSLLCSTPAVCPLMFFWMFGLGVSWHFRASTCIPLWNPKKNPSRKIRSFCDPQPWKRPRDHSTSKRRPKPWKGSGPQTGIELGIGRLHRSDVGEVTSPRKTEGLTVEPTNPKR